MKAKILLSLSLLAFLHSAVGQGALTPPAAPAPTMKTLAQIEPRTPISSIPTTISVPGSYYLTTNLAGIAASAGIAISASDVTLDLNGFTLIGVAGSTDGINISGARTNITIRNGTVRGWGANGVDGSSIVNSRLVDLSVSSNGGRGINIGSGNVINGCTARNNGSDGIYTANYNVISGCAAHNNTGHGLRVATGGRIVDSVSTGNGSNGIEAGFDSSVSGCSAFANVADGVSVGDGSTVIGCASRSNLVDGIVGTVSCRVVDCTAARNIDDGVDLGTGGSVSGCTVYDNADRGINAAFGCTVSACSAYSNTGTGIFANSGSSVFQCASYQNPTNGITVSNGRVSGCTARGNSGNGIVADSSLVENNNCIGNTLAAIRITSSQSRVENNNCGGGQRGIHVLNPDNIIIRNTVTGASVLAYDIIAGNSYGTINSIAGGAIITTGNSFANFEY
ncbi:MAG: right-handed parallel beta-helix repeat-containing protein [Verrucomicrobiota bacterium]